ncbi:MAG: metal ABC transporter permease [Acidobacteriota bacterium]|nr:metal ABC transporter permease [Acidobacteriota bacterium]
MHSANYTSFWIAVLVGIASGSVGPFILLRRMALVGDALSHVALPGIALALLYGTDPFYGVILFLTLAAALIYWLEGTSRLPTDAIVGILFTASLAVGILIIPNADIIESLFGAFPVMSLWFVIVILSSAAVLSILCFVLARRFLFRIASTDLAAVHSFGRKYDLALLLIFALIVGLGIKLVGTLLMGALTIIPAAVAKNVSRSMRGYLILSAMLGGVISAGGIWMADAFRLLPGPCIILFGVGLFLLSLVVSRRRTV